MLEIKHAINCSFYQCLCFSCCFEAVIKNVTRATLDTFVILLSQLVYENLVDFKCQCVVEYFYKLEIKKKKLIIF